MSARLYLSIGTLSLLTFVTLRRDVMRRPFKDTNREAEPPRWTDGKQRSEKPQKFLGSSSKQINLKGEYKDLFMT